MDKTLSTFVNRYNENQDRLWSILLDGRIEAAIAIDGIDVHGQGAHLRWFIVANRFQGTGQGTREWGTEVTEQKFELRLD